MTWAKITCDEREALIDSVGRSYNGPSVESGVGVLSSLTDLDGHLGAPRVFTEWGYDYDRPFLRDERFPNSDRPCEHHRWVPDGEAQQGVPPNQCATCGRLDCHIGFDGKNFHRPVSPHPAQRPAADGETQQ